MGLSFSRPPERLAAELVEVAAAARELLACLDERANKPLPVDFPKDQLADICQSLIRLPDGTAEGCRAALDYARSRLPFVRREHIAIDKPQFVRDDRFLTRGTLVDARLSALISAVLTAWDEYRRVAAEEPQNDGPPEAGISPLPGTIDDALSHSRKLDKVIVAAAHSLDKIASPASQSADDLKRQIEDVRGINQVNSAELQMPKIVSGWLQKLATSLKYYPELIQKTIDGMRVTIDIVEIGYDRWHEFKHNGVHFIFSEIRKTADSCDKVVRILKMKKPGADEVDVEDGYLSFRRACFDVLAEKTYPMRSKEILEELEKTGIADRFRPQLGEKPYKSIYRALTGRYQKTGDVFLVGRGYWALTKTLNKSDAAKLNKTKNNVSAHAEKTRAGLATARASGKKLGAPPKLGVLERQLAERMFAEGASIPKVAVALGVSDPTIRKAYPEKSLWRWRRKDKENAPD